MLNNNWLTGIEKNNRTEEGRERESEREGLRLKKEKKERREKNKKMTVLPAAAMIEPRRDEARKEGRGILKLNSFAN